MDLSTCMHELTKDVLSGSTGRRTPHLVRSTLKRCPIVLSFTPQAGRRLTYNKDAVTLYVDSGTDPQGCSHTLYWSRHFDHTTASVDFPAKGICVLMSPGAWTIEFIMHCDWLFSRGLSQGKWG